MQQFMSFPQVNKVAIYCRLSREDGDSFESSSIQSQKEMLQDYAINNGWIIYDYYIDDGYTGTSFDRPGFKRMINDCEAKKFNIIITKDLSRLGRNYLDTGRYTEEYFPMHNIRYIAVNDNYDSIDASANDFAPFKNIINEWYAKDISKKVRSTFQLKFKKGEIPSAAIPIYGYQFIPGTFKRIIDPETAPIVKLIFEMFIEGHCTKEIIKKINELKAYNPGYYMYKKYNFKSENYINCTEEEGLKWNRQQIYRIIEKREEYAGTLIVGKTQKISFKLKKRISVKKNNCNRFENSYEPIITKQMLAQTEKIVVNHSYSSIPLDQNIMKDLLVCKSCGTLMKFRNFKYNGVNTPRYLCRCQSCKSHAAIRVDSIKTMADNEIKKLFIQIIPHKKKFLEVAENYLQTKNKKKRTKSEETILNDITTNKKRLKELETLVQKLFESRVSDDIPQVVYDRMMKKYKDEINVINIKLEELKNLMPKEEDEIDYAELALEFYERLVAIDIDNISRRNLLSIFDSITVEKVADREYNVHFRVKFIPSLIEVYLNELNK